MAYRIDPAADASAEVLRVCHEQLRKAARRLTTGEPDAVAVRDVRKRIKKVRAVLRLARGLFRPPVLEEAHDRLRSVAHALAASRDADAAVETATGLRDHAAPGLTGRVDEFTRSLRARAGHTHAASPLTSERCRDLAATLTGTVALLQNEPAGPPGWPGLAVGFRRTYEQGRKRLDIVAAAVLPMPGSRLAEVPDALDGITNGVDAEAEALHNWRKRVKDLWYQQRLLQDVWPEAVQLSAAAAGRLAKALGADHDLAMLGDLLDAPARLVPVPDHRTVGSGTSGSVTDEMQALIEARRAELRDEISALGRRLYAEEPAAYTARFGAWFRAGPAPAPLVETDAAQTA